MLLKFFIGSQGSRWLVFSARPLQNKQCFKSSQKGLPWGNLQGNTPSSISFIACFLKKVCITYLFSHWPQGSFMNTESCSHWLCKPLLQTCTNGHAHIAMVTSLSPWPLISLLKKSHSSIMFNLGKKPQTNKFYIPFKGSNEVTMVFSGNGPIFALQ